MFFRESGNIGAATVKERWNKPLPYCRGSVDSIVYSVSSQRAKTIRADWTTAQTVPRTAKSAYNDQIRHRGQGRQPLEKVAR